MVNQNLKIKISSIRSFKVDARLNALLTIVLLLVSGFVLGQSQAELQLRLEREAKYEAWRVIREYESYHEWGFVNDFKLLFSHDATHIVDIPFFNQNKAPVTLPVRDYLRSFSSLAATNNYFFVEVHPLHMDVKREQDDLLIEVYCQKRFLGGLDVLGSELAYPEAQHLIFTIAVINSDEVIEYWSSGLETKDGYAVPPSLKLEIEKVSWHYHQEDFFLTLIQKDKNADFDFPCQGQEILLDSPNWFLLRSQSEKWVVTDSNGYFIDIEMSAERHNPDASRDSVLRPREIPDRAKKRWVWEVGVGMVTSSDNFVEDELGNKGLWMLKQSSGLYSGFGYSVQQSDQRIWDVKFGIGISNDHFEFTAQQVAFEESSVDPDGFQYIRQTRASGWLELINEKAIFAEFSTLGLWAISDESRPKFWLGVQGGYSVGMWSQVMTNSEAQIFHQGYYPTLYGITIDEAGIYDFGSHNGSGTGQHQWKGSGQINLSGLIGVQVHPAWMVVGKIGGVRATRRAGDDELRYMDGTNTLNAASQQVQSLAINGMAFSIGLRKRITGQDKIELPCIE